MKESDEKLWQDFLNGNLPKKITSYKAMRGLLNPEKVLFNKKLDLHFHTVQAAFEAFTLFIETHHKTKTKTVLVITGKSGSIKKECETWFQNNVYIRSFEEKNGGGAYIIKMKK